MHDNKRISIATIDDSIPGSVRLSPSHAIQYYLVVPS
jgi:hypothetical protein